VNLGTGYSFPELIRGMSNLSPNSGGTASVPPDDGVSSGEDDQDRTNPPSLGKQVGMILGYMKGKVMYKSGYEFDNFKGGRVD